MNKIDETIANMITENNHLGGKTMENVYNTANDVLPENAAAAETADFYNEEGLLCCGVCGQPKEQFLPEDISASVRRVKDRMAIPCACGQVIAGEKNARDEARKHAEMVKKLRDKCFSTPAMRNSTFANDNGKNPKMVLVCNFVAHWEEILEKCLGVFIWGPPSTGKSFAAACVANALIEKGYSVIMTNLSEYMDLPIAEREARLDALASCDLLIIDDFGMERRTEFAYEQIFKVIDRRYQSRKPILITSNLTKEQLHHPENLEEERIFGRVRTMCPQLICFDGENMREASIPQAKAEMTKLLTGESV